MRHISVFQNAKAIKPISRTGLSLICDDIKEGAFKQQIEQLRSEQDKKVRNRIKLSLPAFTVSGEFIQRKKEGLKSHSHYYILDFDGVKDVEAMKEHLMTYKGITCAFRSPSGNGVKAVLSAFYHRGLDSITVHGIVWQYIEETFGHLEGFDQSGKDVCRLCFYSYDEKLLSDKRNGIDLTEHEPKKKEQKKSEPIIYDDNHRVLKTAVDMIKAAADGEKHHTLLKATNLVGGYVDSKEVSYDTAFDVLEDAILTRGVDDEQQARKTITDGLNNGMKRPLKTEEKKPRSSSTSKDDIRKEVKEESNKRVPLLVEEYINSKFNIKYNIVDNKLYKDVEGELIQIDDRQVNSMWMEMNRAELGKKTVPLQTVQHVLTSDSVAKEYDPIKEYFEGLEEWDGVDYLGEVLDCVKLKCKDQLHKDYFYTMMKKALIRCIRGAMDKVENRMVITFVDKQQEIGKTRFIKYLNPFGYKYYCDESILDTQEKDLMQSLTKNFIYNVEEIDEMNTKELSKFKRILSKTSVSVRPAYARHEVEKMRICSFFASTNNIEFLTDDRNTRWIPFEIESIDYDTYSKIDNRLLWIQIYTLYKSGEVCDLTDEEKEMRDINNQEFEVRTDEENFIIKYFEPCSMEDAQSVFVSSSEIKAIVSKTTTIKLNTRKIYTALSKLNFIKTRDGQRRGYYVKPTASYTQEVMGNYLSASSGEEPSKKIA